MAGLTEVPVVVKELNDTEASAIMLVENLQREDLNPVEVARGLKRLIDEFGLTQEETAKIVGISRPNLTNSLRLLSLPANVLDFLASGDITSGHARTLLPLGSEEAINEALDVVLAKQLSVRDTEKYVKNLLTRRERGNVQEEKRTAKANSKSIWTNCRKRSPASSAGKAVIAASGRKKGAGRLEIEYYNNEDLETLLKQLCGDDIFDDSKISRNSCRKTALCKGVRRL